MNLLPLDIGRFRLVDVGDDDELRSEVCKRMVRSHSRSLAGMGKQWIPCRTHPAPNVFVNMVVSADGEEDGSFMIYDLTTNAVTGNVKNVSCVPAAAINSEAGSDEWIDDMVEILGFFLDNEIECDDGTLIDVSEWKFPTVSTGSLAEHQWVFGAERFSADSAGEADPVRVGVFVSKMASAGVAVDLDESGVPLLAYIPDV